MAFPIAPAILGAARPAGRGTEDTPAETLLRLYAWMQLARVATTASSTYSARA